MKQQVSGICLALLTLLSCASAQSRTLTFADVPSGTALLSSPLYRTTYRVRFDAFQASDHAGATWGFPRSMPNVAVYSGTPTASGGQVDFGNVTPYAMEPDYLRVAGACFSTAADAVLTMTAYRLVTIGGINYTQPVTSIVIGSPGQSWDNVYVEIDSPDVPFYKLVFRGVNSPNDLLGFCMDDMTITYVPEPSSLLALCAGIGAMGAGIRRRRGR